MTQQLKVLLAKPEDDPSSVPETDMVEGKNLDLRVLKPTQWLNTCVTQARPYVWNSHP